MEVYAINSLFWVMMKTSGEDVDTTLREDYKLEMGRLKDTQERLASLETASQRPRFDKEAISRFVQRGLGIHQRVGPRNVVEDENVEQESEVPYSQRRNDYEPYSKRRNNNDSGVPYSQRRNKHTYFQDSGYQDEVDRTRESQDEVDEDEEIIDEDEAMEEDSEMPYDNGRNQHSYFQDSGYQDEVGGSQESQEQDEELTQHTGHTKKTKKVKKKSSASMSQLHQENYSEPANDTSGYKGSDEDSCLPTPDKKLVKKKLSNGTKKKVKKALDGTSKKVKKVSDGTKKKVKVSKLENSESLLSKSKVLKKKNLSPGSKLKKLGKKNLLPDDQGNMPEVKKKKKKTANVSAADVDDQTDIPVVKKKKKKTANVSTADVDDQADIPVVKKKKKKSANVSASDIAAFLDTTRSSINYEIETEEDLSKKSRQWYEQGWT